jgi:hypothetical protein
MGIACAFAFDCLRELRKGGVRGAPIIELGVGGALVLISAFVARALARPYADCSFKAAVQLRKGTRLESITSAFDGLSGFSKAIGLTPSWLLIGVLIVAIWAVAARKGGVRTGVIATLLLLLYPISLGKQSFGILQGVVLTLLVVSWFFAVKQLHCVLPFLFTVLAMGFVWSRPWHYGMALTAFLVSIWGAWPAEKSAKFEAPKLALAVSLAVLVVWQVPATAKTIVAEVREPYSGARATAQYLEPQVGHRRIYCVNFYGTAIEPYFDHNIFANWPDAYWTWSTHRAAQANRVLDQDLPANAIVVVPFGGLSSPKPARSNAASAKLTSQGFQKTKEFCGAQFWLGSVSEYECYDIYQRRR